MQYDIPTRRITQRKRNNWRQIVPFLADFATMLLLAAFFAGLIWFMGALAMGGAI